ncbi:MAG: monovalent cation/H+ antiporter complex subunit F [Acidobacteria bacterium]|jgi:multicomponent Na+:H+ antiporter subunit F|nr:monovalent cation/H+ antiporter complex subunit F [Acidobacteriota bacterium]
MENFFVALTVLLTVIIFIPIIRVLRGPTLFDRILGAGAISTKTMVLILMVGMVFNRLDMFIDITMAYAILNFIGNIAIAKYLESRGKRKR